LSSNSLHSLESLTNCPNLTELFLRGNQIDDFEEVQYLSDLPNLRILWLSENPIADDPSYRTNVLQMLPNLMRLDDGDVTEADHRGVTPGMRGGIGATFSGIGAEEQPSSGSLKRKMKSSKRMEDGNQEIESTSKKIINDSGLDFRESLRRGKGEGSFQPVRPGRPEVTDREGGDETKQRAVLGGTPQMGVGRGVTVAANKREGRERRRRRREDDQLILSAILTLLPELNVESLKIVINSCTELSK
jgi:hypothetical protein